MSKLRYCLFFGALSFFSSSSIWAQEVPAATKGQEEPATLPEITDGKWRIGGAVRTRYDYVKNNQQDAISYFGIDTARLEADYTSSSWFGSMQYRFYGRFYPYQYENNFGRINFPVFAWAGYKFTPEHSLVAGINMIPFGLPYDSSAFYQTLVNVGGLEDVHNLGIKYQYKQDNVYVDLGFYPRDGGNWSGTTEDSARYTVNVVKTGNELDNGTNNRERNQWVGRLGYVFHHAEKMRSEFGVSALYSSLRNSDTHQSGRRRAYALHYAGQYDAFGVMAQYARQNMSPRNPNGTSNDHVSFGAFDGAFNVAAKGDLYSLELNYTVPWSNEWIKDIKPYLSYSAFDKDVSTFKTSQRVIAGVQFANGPIFTYLEMRWGRNDPYTGDFTDGLAAGGSDAWNRAIHANIGYYF